MSEPLAPSPLRRILFAFRRLLGFPSPGLAGPDGTDRRTEPRFNAQELELTSARLPATVIAGPAIVQTEVFDLSRRGICFTTRGEEKVFYAGRLVEAKLVLEGMEHRLTLKVIERRETFVGCRIIDASSAWAGCAARYLDPLEMGRRLREVRPDLIRSQDPAKVLRWFQGGPACELFVWSSPEGDVLKIQLTFGWDVVEWEPPHGFRTGRLTAPSMDKADRAYPMAKVYELRSPPDAAMIAAARRMVRASRLPEPIQKIFAGA